MDPVQRRELLAEADQHDILRAAYTPERHPRYDLSAPEAFAFRSLATGEEELDIDATKRAETAKATRAIANPTTTGLGGRGHP